MSLYHRFGCRNMKASIHRFSQQSLSPTFAKKVSPRMTGVVTDDPNHQDNITSNSKRIWGQANTHGRGLREYLTAKKLENDREDNPEGLPVQSAHRDDKNSLRKEPENRCKHEPKAHGNIYAAKQRFLQRISLCECEWKPFY
jgi:hypothetical protein